MNHTLTVRGAYSTDFKSKKEILALQSAKVLLLRLSVITEVKTIPDKA